MPQGSDVLAPDIVIGYVGESGDFQQLKRWQGMSKDGKLDRGERNTDLKW